MNTTQTFYEPKVHKKNTQASKHVQVTSVVHHEAQFKLTSEKQSSLSLGMWELQITGPIALVYSTEGGLSRY